MPRIKTVHWMEREEAKDAMEAATTDGCFFSVGWRLRTGGKGGKQAGEVRIKTVQSWVPGKAYSDYTPSDTPSDSTSPKKRDPHLFLVRGMDGARRGIGEPDHPTSLCLLTLFMIRKGKTVWFFKNCRDSEILYAAMVASKEITSETEELGESELKDGVTVTLALGYRKGEGGGHWEEVRLDVDHPDLGHDESMLEAGLAALPNEQRIREDLVFVHLLKWEENNEETGD